MSLKNKKLFICLITVFIVLSGIIYSGMKDEILYSDAVDKYDFGNIKVDVSGSVKNPGIYILDFDSRIEDALKMAGGITENADISYVNRADFLIDGDKIYVPYKNESIDEIYLKSRKSLDKEESLDYIININEDGLYKLMLLPGIGEKTAEKIIAYRNENGRFSAIEDLMNVSGIGKATLNEISNYIILD